MAEKPQADAPDAPDSPDSAGPRTDAPAGGTPPSWQTPTEPESRWLVFVAIAVIIAGQTWVANSLSLRPVWLLPSIAAVLLAGSVAVYLPSRTIPSRAARVLSIGLVGVLVVATVVSLVLLVRGVFVGSSLSPVGLLLTGIALWVVNLAVFALSFTAATAFSPTDAMPYSKRAKSAMGTESALSFVIAAMLVARAINIARG